MEIPVLNRIGDFETRITSLHNPSFLFLKWGALILAVVASLSTILKRIIFRLHCSFFPPPSSPVSIPYDYSYDSDTDSSCSSVSSSSQDDQDYENEQEEDEDDEEPIGSLDDDFSVKGYDQNHGLRKRRNRSIEDLFSSFAELTNGKNVVKLWDNLGLGFRFNAGIESSNHISLYDTNSDRSLFSSPAVIVSAETNVSAHLLKVRDTRVGGRLPEILAEWRPKLGKIVGIGGGHVTGRLTVGDLRKAQSPLAMTESNEDTWWDADGGGK
ncbi:hypothetical protein M5689_006461 [Euphorbia peplus]|nr:hypothetical protein M5689_006461 [Euphorbia peplus]